MRRLLVVLVLLAAALVGLDRLAAFAAERAIAHKLETDYSLGVAPQVHIAGFPFLTQAVTGDYQEVTATLRDVRRGNVTADRVSVRLYGLRVPLSDVLHRRVHELPTDRTDAEVLLSYADINAFLGNRGIRVSGGTAGHVRISGQVGPAQISADAPVTVESERVDLGTDAVSVSLPLPRLPFGIRLVSAQTTGEGLLIRATARDLTVPVK